MRIKDRAKEKDKRRGLRDIPIVRPADIVLAAALVVAGVAFSFFVSFGGGEGQQVRVTAAGKHFGTFPLYEDREVVVKRGEDTNTFRIQNGKVKMMHSNCRGGDCLHEGEISKTGETIVCLPHKVVIEIIGGEEDFDAVSK